MAKKKNKATKKEVVVEDNPQPIAKVYRYKNRMKSLKAKIHNDWLDCTEEVMQKLEKNYPKHFIFEEIKAPEPTPSMLNAMENEEKQ